MIWNVKTVRSSPALVPVNYSQEIADRCVRTASLIPGAKVEKSGMVMGPVSVLAACLNLAGQRLPDEFMDPRWDVYEVQPASPLIGWMPDYQAKGAGFVADHAKHGVTINDDLGLGKTFQAIAGMYLLDYQAYKGMPSGVAKVVLCPAGLKRQWEGEIRKWYKLQDEHAWKTLGHAPETEVLPPEIHVIYPRGDKRSKVPCPPNVEWIIAYYKDTDRALELLKHRSYYLIVDEAHNLTGWKTERANSVKSMRTFAMGAVFLTASDLTNKMDGLYSTLALANPGHWGSPSDFAIRYASGFVDDLEGLKWGELSREEELNLRRSYYRYRRIKADVADQLPFDTQYQTIWLEPPTGTIRDLTGMAKTGLVTKEYLAKVNEFKLPTVAEQILSDSSAGIPGLTFTWTREQANTLGSLVPGSMVVHGEDGRKDRLEEIYQYVARCQTLGGVPQVIATMDCMGTGGNLQMFKVVNVTALHPTPELMRQSIGRVARMGQVGTVIVRFFVCKYTTDEHMLEINLSKLREAIKLDGREEPEKAGIIEALTEHNMKDVLAGILEKYRQQEAQQPTP